MSFLIELNKKRNKLFEEWDEAYNTIKSELDSLISSFEDIRKIPLPEFQDLTIKFYTIHLCNFFFFHIRKLLVEKNSGNETLKLFRNAFSNPSNTPSPASMNDLLSYLISDENSLQTLCGYYKKIQEIRNKYAHGASNETTLNITMDEFKTIYEDVKTIK